MANLVRGGDVFLSTALLPGLRARHPSAHITCACAPAFAELLTGNPCIDEILPFGSDAFSESCWNDITALALSYGAAYLLQPYPDLGEAFFTTLRGGAWHLLDIFAAKGGVWHGFRKPELFLTEEELTGAREVIAGQGVHPVEPYAVLHIAAGDRCKSWPAHSLADLVATLSLTCPHLRLLLLGGAESTGIRLPHVCNLAGRTSLRQSAAIIAGAALFVGVDSLPAHLTALRDTPAVIIHGGTLPHYCGAINTRATFLAAPAASDISPREVAAAISAVTAGRFSPDTTLPGPRWATARKHQGVVSIVILTWNQLDYTRQCVAAIERHTPEPHEIIFVDNGSTDGTVAWLRDLVAVTPRYRLIANGENRGFAAGCNQGLQAATGEYLLLLNNDVVVTPGWLGGLVACFSAAPDVGIAGPMTNAASGPQVWGRPGYDSLEGLDSFAANFRRERRHLRIPSPRLVGFCMLFSRSLMERIGLLDERFGSGNFEDDDYCYRASLEGYRNVIAGDVYVHHFGSVTFAGNAVNHDAAMRRNHGLFSRKWRDETRLPDTARKILALQTLEKARERVLGWDVEEGVRVLLDEGIRFLPDDPRLYHALAEGLLDSGRFTDAAETIGSMPEASRTAFSDVLEGRAMVGLGRLEEAQRLANRALARMETGEALVLLGTVALAQGDAQLARVRFTHAIAAAPHLGMAYSRLGLAVEAVDEGESFRLVEKGFQLTPLDPVCAETYHAAVCARGAHAEGAARFREALSLFPAGRSLRYLLIDLLVNSGRLEEALAEIEEVIVRFGADDSLLDSAQDIRRHVGLHRGPFHGSAQAISLCMIVKDEREQLPRCLGSLLSLVDEIIVVDTGSADRSGDVAHVFGAHVIHFPWTGSFSEARNRAVEAAEGAWILVMDADEAISRRDHAAIRDLVRARQVPQAAFSFVTRNYTTRVDQEGWHRNDGEYPSEEAGCGWVPSTKVRLFPNAPGVRFVNQVHELVEPSLERIGIPTVDVTVPIHHFGYLDPEKNRRKTAMYYELGKRKLHEHPDDVKALVELAVQAGEIGLHAEAVGLWKRVVELNPHLPMAWLNLGFNHLEVDELEEAFAATERAAALGHHYPDVAYNLALCDLSRGRPVDAARRVEDALRRNDGDVKLHLALGLALCASGRDEEGWRHLDVVAAERIDFLPVVRELTGRMVRCQNADRGRELVEALIAGGYGDEELRQSLA